jgi:hypothetical protein
MRVHTGVRGDAGSNLSHKLTLAGGDELLPQTLCRRRVGVHRRSQRRDGRRSHRPTDIASLRWMQSKVMHMA